MQCVAESYPIKPVSTSKPGGHGRDNVAGIPQVIDIYLAEETRNDEAYSFEPLGKSCRKRALSASGDSVDPEQSAGIVVFTSPLEKIGEGAFPGVLQAYGVRVVVGADGLQEVVNIR